MMLRMRVEPARCCLLNNERLFGNVLVICIFISHLSTSSSVVKILFLLDSDISGFIESMLLIYSTV